MNFQTWVTQQVGMDNLQIHLWRHTIMTSQRRSKNVTKIVKNYHFEWLSTPIAFVIFDVEAWYYHWSKCMHIRRYCINFVYFNQHFHTINYTKNMTPILRYLWYFNVLVVIQDWVNFKNNVCFHNSLCFKIRKLLCLHAFMPLCLHVKLEKYNEGEKVMTSYWWRHKSVNNYQNGTKFVLVL